MSTTAAKSGYTYQTSSDTDSGGTGGARLETLEYLTVMRYIHKHLKPDMKILVIGAGTGDYATALASESFNVTAVEMNKVRLDELYSKVTGNMKLTTYRGEITDLGFIGSDTYDITLVLGPMYHLYSFADKKQAIKEALRVTKPNGVIFVSYCLSDAFINMQCFGKGRVHELIENGLLDEADFKLRCEPGLMEAMVNKSEIDKLMAEFTVMRLHYVSIHPYMGNTGECIEKMDEKTFELYVKYHLTICERSDLVGAAHRCLDVFRKNKALQLRYVEY